MDKVLIDDLLNKSEHINEDIKNFLQEDDYYSLEQFCNNDNIERVINTLDFYCYAVFLKKTKSFPKDTRKIETLQNKANDILKFINDGTLWLDDKAQILSDMLTNFIDDPESFRPVPVKPKLSTWNELVKQLKEITNSNTDTSIHIQNFCSKFILILK